MRLLSRWLLRLSLLVVTLPVETPADEPIDIGSKRELFVDDFLIDSSHNIERRLHRPVPQEVAIVHDEPWEGNVSYYHTVFQDGDLYRMYYRAAHAGTRTTYADAVGHQVVCYAESTDGIRWTKPQLDLHEFKGSKANNIIWKGIGSHNFVPFRDANPNCRPKARYKAIGHGKGGLYAFQSPDAIHWSLITKKPVITKGAFDSQNLAFYDSVRGRYVDFHRGFNKGVRAIMTCTSSDFVHWTEPEWIEFTDSRNEHLYTNQTIAYPRAPHIFMAFPKRFLPKRNPALHRYPGTSDIVFMTSRDGRTFHRRGEAFIRPGLQQERWVNRNNFVAWGIVETATKLTGAAPDLSFYSIEGYYTGDDCRLRRYTLRPDGFVSVNAQYSGGELLTKPLTFALPAADVPRLPPDEPKLRLRIDTEQPIRGAGSLTFDGPAILSLDGTQNLGRHATLAVAVRGVPKGLRRLFSTYNGGTTEPHELYFDINSGGTIGKKNGYSIRFNYNGVLVGAKFTDIGNWSTEEGDASVHHLAATWDDGEIALYFDGRQVAAGGTAGGGDLKFAAGNLHFGEDYPPTALENEAFRGTADDILVLRKTLTPKQIAELASASIERGEFPEYDNGILLTGDNANAPLVDELSADGIQTVTGPSGNRPGEVALLVNFATSAAGSIQCEIQEADGTPIPGFTLQESDELYGDSLEHAMSWDGRQELKSLAGRPVRLRFVMRDADLYSLRFGR